MAFLSSSMPSHLQGTGFGVFFSISGTAILIYNGFIMGTVWECYAPSTAFLVVYPRNYFLFIPSFCQSIDAS